MSDILDDLKMLADHCDQENGDEPCDLGMLLIRAIGEIRKLRSQPVSAAEVPMPEPDTHCYDDDVGRDVWSHSPEQMRTYGEQCRAAGYAAGVAAGLGTLLRRKHGNTDDNRM
jgi:hypothetical protein